MKPKPLIQKLDCVRFYVPDLESGLAFYRDQLGHELIWRTDKAVGLRLPGTDAEIVLHTEPQEPEIDFARRLTVEHGVAAIPPSVFYRSGDDHRRLRFCFAKKDKTLKEAADRLCRV